MICPRCDSDKAHVLVEAPVGGASVWTVYLCDNCFYSWRNTESEAVTTSALYSKTWKLTNEMIANLQMIPPIPPLKK